MSIPKPVVHLSDIAVYKQLINDQQKASVVKFTAPWCGPCKRIAPKFEELAKEHSSCVGFYEVDIDSANAITDFENVQSIPLFLFFKGGEKRKALEIRGANVQTLEANIKTLVAEVNMAKLVLDDVVESDDDDVGSEVAEPDYDSESHNEYGQDCEIPIEKTIPEDMIKSSDDKEL